MLSRCCGRDCLFTSLATGDISILVENGDNHQGVSGFEILGSLDHGTMSDLRSDLLQQLLSRFPTFAVLVEESLQDRFFQPSKVSCTGRLLQMLGEPTEGPFPHIGGSFTSNGCGQIAYQGINRHLHHP